MKKRPEVNRFFSKNRLNKQGYVGRVLGLCLLLFLGGCLNSGTSSIEEESGSALISTGEASGSSTGQIFTCADVNLSASSAKPLSTLQLSALPSDFGEFPALGVRSQDGVDSLLVPVERQAKGGSFLVPPHPNGKREGGQVTLQLLDGAGQSCEPIAFQIEPLPMKPGAFADLVELINQVNQEEQRILGRVPERAADPNAEQSPFDQPFDLVEDWLHGEDNPNSLDKIVEGDAPATADLTASDWELIDSLIEESGILSELEKQVDRLQDVEPIPNEEANVGVEASPEKSFLCKGPFYKPDARTLSALMWMQIENEIGADVAKKTKLLEYSATLWTASGMMFTATTGGKPNPLAAGAGAMSSALGSWETMMNAMDGLLPSEMVKLEFDYDKAIYLEDEVDLSGKWENVRLTTRSKGWNADANLFSMLVGRATGGLTKKWMNHHQTEAVTKEVGKYLQDTFNKQAGQVLADARAQDGHPGIFAVPPCEFGPTDISDEQYSEGKFADPLRAPAEITGHGTYRVRDTGLATLVVTANSNMFAKRSILDSQPVEIKPIEVVVDPDNFQGDPGDVAVFTVTVHNAQDPSLDFSLDPVGQHQMYVQQDSETSYTVTIATSPDGDDFPSLLLAKSTAATGLRALPTAPPRIGSAILRSGGEVIVSPGTACVKPGESKRFTAEVIDLNFKEFTWSASAGSMTKDGQFTAPKTTGTKVTITAAAVANPKITGEAEVMVGDCTCWGNASFSVGGMISGTVHEAYKVDPFITAINWNEKDDERLHDLLINFNPLGGEGNNALMLLFGEQGPRLGETGTFPAQIGGQFARFGHSLGHDFRADVGFAGMLLPPFASMGRENMQPEIDVVIEEFSAGPQAGTAFIKGKVSGNVHYLFIHDEYADDVGSIDVEFWGYYDISTPFGTTCSGAGW